MQLKEFLKSLSLPGTGTKKIKTLLFMTQTTIEAIRLVEENEDASVSYIRDLEALKAKLEDTLRRRSWINSYDSEKGLRDELRTGIEIVQSAYMEESLDEAAFCELYKTTLFKKCETEGIPDAISRKAFEEGVVRTVQSAEDSSKPEEFNVVKSFVEFFSTSQGTRRSRILPWPQNTSSTQPEANPRISEVTGSIHDSDFHICNFDPGCDFCEHAHWSNE